MTLRILQINDLQKDNHSLITLKQLEKAPPPLRQRGSSSRVLPLLDLGWHCLDMDSGLDFRPTQGSRKSPFSNF